ncbi:MAG: PilZ domain-containing protein [Candidatus Sulfotelmatobacter sp.]|jgi:CheY-like chemotaxis protein
MSDFPAPATDDGIETRAPVPQTTVGVRALLISGDIQTIDTLCHFMGQLAMHVEVCSDFALASSKLSHSKFEALVLDFKQREEALELLKTLRQITSHKASVVIAILNSNEEMPDAFRAGASFVLVRPLSSQVLKRTLRVSYPLMVHERRRHFRCPAQISVHVSVGSEPEFAATSANISESGIALSNAPGLKVGDKVSLRLILPGTKVPSKINAEVCWRNDAGSAGLQFVNVPMSVKEELATWLADRLEEYLHGNAVVKG